MKNLNIYLAGVGGQGIGLLTEILLRAADHAGLGVKCVDTHGLAQRGGIVISQLRLGPNTHSPMIPDGEADIAVALERHEALRAANFALKDEGTLIYYNAVWQPLEVRLGGAEEISEDQIKEECQKRGIREIKVFKEDLEDSRMQNMVLLAGMAKAKLVPEIEEEHFFKAMDDLMQGTMLEKNMELFKKEIS